MTEPYNYERYNPKIKKNRDNKFGANTALSTGAMLLGGPLGLLMGGSTLDQSQKADNPEYDDPEQALQIAKENRRRAALANMPTKGPEMSSEMSNRISAWQQESAQPTDTSYFDKQVHEGPLATDTRFQRDQGLLSAGAASQAANVVNRQAATGTRGGFENTGSIADVYDRLGSQLAGMGQKQQELNQNIREQKFGYMEQERARKAQLADRSAQAKQQFLDSQIQHANMLKQARGAIETGDVELGMKLITDAEAFRRDQKNRYDAFWGNVLGGVIQGAATVGGAAIGGPAGAKVGTAAGKAAAAGFSRSADAQLAAASANNAYNQDFSKYQLGSQFGGRKPRL